MNYNYSPILAAANHDPSPKLNVATAEAPQVMIVTLSKESWVAGEPGSRLVVKHGEPCW